MAPISTKLHGVGDIAGAALALSAPRLLPIRDRRAQGMALLAGGGMLVNGALTDYELGVRRRLSMPAHLLIDAIGGGLLLAAADSLRRSKRTRIADWLPHAALGMGQIAGAALTERQPRGGARSPSNGAPGAASASTSGSSPSMPAPSPPLPSAATGASGHGIAAHSPARSFGTSSLAPPPLETPKPSVSAPAEPDSDVERHERTNPAMAGAGSPPTGDTLVAQEEAAASAEAAAIGGAVPSDNADPAMDPVYQAGGGEQDGWEAVEAELIENATHGDGHAQPERDAFSPELESDRSTAVYGEADHIAASEVVKDPESPRDDPGAGPGIVADRGH